MGRGKQQDAAEVNFWEKPLTELNESEWERLCDGCGRCCLKKLSNESGEIFYTRVVCRYFEQSTSRCTSYGKRTELVPDCLNVRQIEMSDINWMPNTCAYRLRFEGKPLYAWHPLIAGTRTLMQQAGIGIADRAISEEYVHPDGYEEHIIRWVSA